mgnify:CR=1 FL=1
MTVIGDLAAFDLDPRLQLVRLPEEVGSVHRLECGRPDPEAGRRSGATPNVNGASATLNRFRRNP